MLSINADTLVETGGIWYLTLYSGEYEEYDLVEVYREGDELKTSIGAFQACFIANGYHYAEITPEGE